MENNQIFTLLGSKMKMADLLSKNNRIINLLPRLGIPLGFGEKSVKQVCEEYKVSMPLFLLLCKVYLQDDCIFNIEEIKSCPVEDIVRYLQASHLDYLNNEFPHIENHLREVVHDWNEKYKTSITNFFTEYKKEVVNHFRFEEEVIFPHVKQLVNGLDPHAVKAKAAIFDEQHDHIEDTLLDFTNLIIKYIPTEVAQRERIYMLHDVFSLADDIEKHCIVEEKVLIPYIYELEQYENA